MINIFDVVCAIFYILRSGCAWRILPNDYPKWQTVYWYFNTWRKEKVWQSINDTLRKKLRKASGKNKEPSAGVIDSQSIKTTDKGGLKGYDAGKKTKGRKRHIIVDTLGLLLGVVVHSAGIQDRDGAKLVLEKIKGLFSRLVLIWADGGYAGKLIEWVKKNRKISNFCSQNFAIICYGRSKPGDKKRSDIDKFMCCRTG